MKEKIKDPSSCISGAGLEDTVVNKMSFPLGLTISLKVQLSECIKDDEGGTRSVSVVQPNLGSGGSGCSAVMAAAALAVVVEALGSCSATAA